MCARASCYCCLYVFLFLRPTSLFFPFCSPIGSCFVFIGKNRGNSTLPEQARKGMMDLSIISKRQKSLMCILSLLFISPSSLRPFTLSIHVHRYFLSSFCEDFFFHLISPSERRTQRETKGDQCEMPARYWSVLSLPSLSLSLSHSLCFLSLSFFLRFLSPSFLETEERERELKPIQSIHTRKACVAWIQQTPKTKKKHQTKKKKRGQRERGGNSKTGIGGAGWENKKTRRIVMPIPSTRFSVPLFLCVPSFTPLLQKKKNKIKKIGSTDRLRNVRASLFVVYITYIGVKKVREDRWVLPSHPFPYY